MSTELHEGPAIGEPGEAAAGKRKLDPGAKRNLTIMAGVAAAGLVVVAVVAFLGLRSDPKPVTQAASQVALGNPASQRRGPSAAVPERMQQDLAKRQIQEAEEAARKGNSYIPADIPTRMEPVAATPQVLTPQLGPQNSAAAYAAAAVVDTSNLEAERRKNLERFLSSFGEGATQGSVRSRVEASDRDENAGRGANQQQQQRAVASRVQAPVAEQQGAGAAAKLVEAYSIMAARLLVPLDVPENGSAVLVAEVVAGPHAGAVVSGTARVVNEALEMRFTQARLGRQVYPVQAIGLDGTTSAQLLSGSVDRKLFQRYVIPIAAAAAQGFFQAKAAVGSTVVGLSVGAGGDSTVAGVQTPAPTSKQAVAAGAAAGMQVLTADASKIASVPIVVSAPAQTPIGVLFLSEVVHKGDAQ